MPGAKGVTATESETGEDVAELNGHGGAHNLERLLAAVVERAHGSRSRASHACATPMWARADLNRMSHRGSRSAIDEAPADRPCAPCCVALNIFSREIQIPGTVPGLERRGL
jgi:hypothetical protein